MAFEYDFDPRSPIDLTPDTGWEEVSVKLEFRLAELPFPGREELLRAVYHPQPEEYEWDKFPCLVVFQADAGNVGQSHHELDLPNVHRFSVQALHHVVSDDPTSDPLQLAQNVTRKLLGRWMKAFWRNKRLGGEIEMSMTPTITAIQIPGEGGPDLRGWEVSVETKVH